MDISFFSAQAVRLVAKAAKAKSAWLSAEIFAGHDAKDEALSAAHKAWIAYHAANLAAADAAARAAAVSDLFAARAAARAVAARAAEAAAV